MKYWKGHERRNVYTMAWPRPKTSHLSAATEATDSSSSTCFSWSTSSSISSSSPSSFSLQEPLSASWPAKERRTVRHGLRQLLLPARSLRFDFLCLPNPKAISWDPHVRPRGEGGRKREKEGQELERGEKRAQTRGREGSAISRRLCQNQASGEGTANEGKGQKERWWRQRGRAPWRKAHHNSSIQLHLSYNICTYTYLTRREVLFIYFFIFIFIIICFSQPQIDHLSCQKNVLHMLREKTCSAIFHMSISYLLFSNFNQAIVHFVIVRIHIMLLHVFVIG